MFDSHKVKLVLLNTEIVENPKISSSGISTKQEFLALYHIPNNLYTILYVCGSQTFVNHSALDLPSMCPVCIFG